MSKKKNQFDYAISGCLLGLSCKWNQKIKIYPKANKIFLKGDAIAICPEVMGGLPTPRLACEICGGEGKDVLKNTAHVIDQKGKRYDQQFINGAKKCLILIKKLGIKKVILKSGSPSCGVNHIYRGDFSGKKKKGSGVLASLLKQNKIKTIEVM